MAKPNDISLAAVVLALGVACGKSTVTGAPSSSSSSSASSSSPAPTVASSAVPAWLAFAARAPMYGDLAREQRTGIARKPPTLAEIDALFDRMTKVPEAAGGVREAAKMLEEGRYLAADPKWTGSGTSPGATLLHHGGLALLVDLTQRACAASSGNAEIGRTADTIPLPPMFNSGGMDRQAAERDRHVVQEAARPCGASPGP